jgi:alkylation response protein AidB-like acyl-CoA dehydrogenase
LIKEEKIMDFRLTAEQEAFRKEVASCIDRILPEGYDHLVPFHFGSYDKLARVYREFQRGLYDNGFAGMHIPKEYGGQGKTSMEELIVLEEFAAKCTDLWVMGVISRGMACPTILFHGNEEQKRAFLPKILDGTHIWCQGFSEPNAGSDLANVATQAVKENGSYIVNGQKVWTTWAHIADYCIMVVRTKDFGGVKHKGLSYLLVDMRLPGIEVNPIKQLTGEEEFNEVFLNDVRVPEAMLVGEEGQGWEIALTTLMFERAAGDACKGVVHLKNTETMLQMARQAMRGGKPVLEDPIFRQQLGQVYIESLVVKYHGLRSFSNQFRSGVPGPESSIGKLLWSEFNLHTTEVALMMQGLNGQLMGETPWGIQRGLWQMNFLRDRAQTIFGGTSEVQRNIIGERVLKLPKDTSRLGAHP